MTLDLLTDPAKTSAVLSILHATGRTWHAPVCRAALAGEIVAGFLSPGGVVPSVILNDVSKGRPVVILLSGDCKAPCGPEGFPQVRELLRWARAILLNGGHGSARDYEKVVHTTRQAGCVLVAESTAAHLPAWRTITRETARGTPTVVLNPPTTGRVLTPKGLHSAVTNAEAAERAIRAALATLRREVRQ